VSEQMRLIPENTQPMTPTITRLSFTVALGGMTLNYSLADNTSTTPEGAADAVRRVVAVLTGHSDVPQPAGMSPAEVADAAITALGGVK